MKKRISLLLIAAVMAVLLLAPAANAAVSPFSIFRASDYITAYDGYLESNSTGKVTVNFSIIGNDVMTKLGVKTIVLQERAKSTDSWSTYDTYSYEDYSKMMKNKADAYSNGITFDINSGYQYRAKLYFYAEKGGYDTREFITDMIKAK